ncbi:MAG: hypothetical protein JW727_00555 [Candidatus Aenigmarchaeota archaeon]|nr:hypothetical protein [Candidatus Aenigmarchaeota archaeon]
MAGIGSGKVGLLAYRGYWENVSGLARETRGILDKYRNEMPRYSIQSSNFGHPFVIAAGLSEKNKVPFLKDLRVPEEEQSFKVYCLSLGFDPPKGSKGGLTQVDTGGNIEALLGGFKEVGEDVTVDLMRVGLRLSPKLYETLLIGFGNYESTAEKIASEILDAAKERNMEPLKMKRSGGIGRTLRGLFN